MKPGAITVFARRVDTSLRTAISQTATQVIEHDDRHAFVAGSQHLSTGAEWLLLMFIAGIVAMSAISQGAVAAALASGVVASDNSVRIARIKRTTE